MSEDVRKNCRTQGRYSDGKLHKSRDKKQPRRHSEGKSVSNSSLGDETASSVQYKDNSDYTFDQLGEVVAKPEEIKGRGEVILSKTENGESRILYEPRFLYEDEGDKYFNRLYKSINWNEKNIVIHGVEYPQPRLVAWFGPFPYSYSGTTLEPAEMPDIVMEIKEKVERSLQSNGMEASFNSVLVNLYRDGKDSVAWHSDDELMLGISPTIASVSLGETRKFELRPKTQSYADRSPQNQTTKYVVHLTHGSLIVMTGSMQDDWQHRVPKEYHDKDVRINLTFRTVYPLEKTPEHAPAKEINLESQKRQYSGQNISNKTSHSDYKLNDEDFPSLQKDVISAKPNTSSGIFDKPIYPNSKTVAKTEECWDDEISQEQVESIDTHKHTSSVFDRRDEDYKPKCNRKNHLTNKKHSEKWHNIETKCDNAEIPFDDKTAAKKLWCNEYDSSVNGFQENNIVEERPEMKCHKSVNKMSANEVQENKFYKEVDPKKIYDREASLTVKISQQSTISQNESSAKSHNIKPNPCMNAPQKNEVINESSNMYPYGKSNSWVDHSEESILDAKMVSNADAKVFGSSYLNAAQELDNEKQLNTYNYFEDNSRMGFSSESNVEFKKKPTKTALNVDAKEFVPIMMKSNEISQYSNVGLEDLINCDINVIQGKNLQDHALNLKKQVLEIFQGRLINRFERNELEFLLEITDGSQVDKNQRLISTRICRIVQNNLQRLPTHAMPPFDRSSRHRGYENQSYSDKGKRFQNQNRGSKSNRNRF